MLYYVTLIWNSANSANEISARSLLNKFLRSRPGWRMVLDLEGLAVCCYIPSGPNIHRTYLLPNQQGVVLGLLLDTRYVSRDDTHQVPPTPVVLDECEARAILSSNGKRLVQRYWGQFVAFLRNPGSGDRCIVRDPCGGLPCEWTRVQGIDVYFVRLEDCECLDSLTLSINRHYLAGYLVFESVCTRETGFNEIETVLPGECITHRGDERSRTFCWNPFEIVNTDVIEDFDEATRLMRRTVRACVHAWASQFDSIIHQLSGGLDSSIVATCLADAPTRPEVLCRNFFSHDPGSDEREYARQVAARAGFELIEQPIDTSFDFVPNHDATRLPYPIPWNARSTDAAEGEVAFLQAHGVDASFTGNGGDEIFYVGGSLPTAVDYAWRHGVRPKLLSVALNDAVVGHTSLWMILRMARDYGLFKRPWHMRNNFGLTHMPLMSTEAKRQAWRDLSHWHPLYRNPSDVPPGRFAHAYLFTLGASHCYTPPEVDYTVHAIDPLCSLPLIELSLRIPLYVLKSGGQDRTVARQAFATDLPHKIFIRSTKATANAQMQAIADHNVRFIKDLLLDGLLVREGVVDRSRLEQVLSGELTRIQSNIIELCTYISVEIWVRSWQKIRRAAA